jgi:hypothetical protein
MKCIQLSQDRVQCCALVNMEMNLRIVHNRKFLDRLSKCYLFKEDPALVVSVQQSLRLA